MKKLKNLKKFNEKVKEWREYCVKRRKRLKKEAAVRQNIQRYGLHKAIMIKWYILKKQTGKWFYKKSDLERGDRERRRYGWEPNQRTAASTPVH